MAKSSEVVINQRITEVSYMLLNGFSRDDIIHYSSETWEIGERQVDKYIKRAKERIAISIKKDFEYDFAKAIRRYEELFKLSMEKKDYKTAILVTKEISSLQGLSVQIVENTTEVKFISSIPD